MRDVIFHRYDSEVGSLIVNFDDGTETQIPCSELQIKSELKRIFTEIFQESYRENHAEQRTEPPDHPKPPTREEVIRAKREEFERSAEAFDVQSITYDDAARLATVSFSNGSQVLLRGDARQIAQFLLKTRLNANTAAVATDGAEARPLLN